ncbi:hypothetical protein SGLAM104S_03188 [Streptomyces glaucescens]
MFISVSVMPYRSITRRPVAAAIRSWSCTGSAADPETSSRAPVSAFTSSGSPGSASAIRWYIVGTPNSMVAPEFSSAATPSVVNRPRCRTLPPRRSGPRTPSTSPCTWNSGSPCTSTSSPVHRQASASASRVAATTRRGMTAPFGGPVVPEV